MIESDSKPRRRLSKQLAPTVRVWLAAEMEKRELYPKEVGQRLQGKVSLKTVYEILNPSSKRLKFDTRTLYAVVAAIGIDPSEFRKVIGDVGIEQLLPSFKRKSQRGVESEWRAIISRSVITHLLGISEAAFVMQWPRLAASQLEFRLDTTTHYETFMPKIARRLMELLAPGRQFCQSPLNFRIESVTQRKFRHRKPELVLRLSQIPSSLYRITYPCEHSKLRKELFEEYSSDAFNCYKRQERPLLPSILSSRIAVVTSDNKLILRSKKKAFYATGVAGITDKMEVGYCNSPRMDFRIEDCNCRMSAEAFFRPHWFFDCKLEHFSVFGIAMLKERLEPTLISVYETIESFEAMHGLIEWIDSDRKVGSVDLEPNAISGVWKQLDEISQIAAACALIASVKTENEAHALLQQLSRCIASSPTTNLK